MEQIFITITNNIANAIRDKYESFAQHAPYILGSIALFLFGWILAELASRAIIKTSDKIKLEWIADKVGLQHFLQRIKSKLGASHIIAKGVKGYLIFLFSEQLQQGILLYHTMILRNLSPVAFLIPSGLFLPSLDFVQLHLAEHKVFSVPRGFVINYLRGTYQQH